MMYFINRLYANFATHDKIKIKSLHVHSLPGSALSAIHHFLFNSKINISYQNIDWQWAGTINNFVEDPHEMSADLKIKYSKNLLNIFDSGGIAHTNNLKFVVNETLKRMCSRLNFLCIGASEEENCRSHLANAVLAIKLLEPTCIAYIEVPNPSDWTVHTINGLLLYSLLFQELYLFKFTLTNTCRTILICKNKKKVNTQLIYKKIMLLLANPKYRFNLFSLGFMKSNDEIRELVQKILNIQEDRLDVLPIVLNDVMYEISKVLNLNTSTFL